MDGAIPGNPEEPNGSAIGATKYVKDDGIASNRTADGEPVCIRPDYAIALELERESKDARIRADWLRDEPGAGWEPCVAVPRLLSEYRD